MGRIKDGSDLTEGSEGKEGSEGSETFEYSSYTSDITIVKVPLNREKLELWSEEYNIFRPNVLRNPGQIFSF